MERKAKLPKFERDVSSLPKFDFSYSIMQFIYTFLDFADHLSLQKTSPRWEWMGNKEKSWAPALTVDTQGEFVQAFNSGCKKLFALTYTGLYTVYFFYETGLYKRPPPLTWWNQLRTLCLVHRDKSFNNLLAKGEINRHQELKSLTTLQLQGWCYPLHSARHLPPTLTALEATLYVSAGSNPWSADALPLLRRVKLAYEVCPYGHWTPYAEDVLPHRHPLLESVDVDIANLRIGYVDGLGRWESLDWKTQCLTSLRISSSSGGWDIVYHGPEIFRNLMEANKGLKRLELPGNNICDKLEYLGRVVIDQIETLYIEEDRKTSTRNISDYLKEANHIKVLELGNTDGNRNFGTASVIARHLIGKRDVQLVPRGQPIPQAGVLTIVYIP